MTELEKIIPTRFTASAEIALNDNKVIITGGGPLVNEKGQIHGKYLIENLPEDLDAKIFKTVLVTGYPSVCDDNNKLSASPFKLSDYRYDRVVDFGEHGKISYHAECFYERDEKTGELVLVSNFTGEGNIKFGQIDEGSSVSEIWVPASSNIDGKFEVVFKCAQTGKAIRGTATTVYKFANPSISLDTIEHRFISFPKIVAGKNFLELEQHSYIN